MEVSANLIPSVAATPPAPVPEAPKPKAPEKPKRPPRPNTLRLYYVGGLQIASITRFHDANGGSYLCLVWPEGSIGVPSIEAGDQMLLARLRDQPRPYPEGLQIQSPPGFRIRFHVEPDVDVTQIHEEPNHDGA
jgi:hypothetical protein